MAKILVVDDVKTIRAAVKICLNELGHEVLEAPDVPHALLLFKSHKFDLVVSDCNMPGMSGLDLLRSMHKVQPSLPFLMLTSEADKEKLKAALTLGVSGWVVKPFQKEKLQENITALLEKAKKAVPLVKPTSYVGNPAGKLGFSLKNRKVLIVDDMAVIRRLVRVTLVDMGFEVVEATQATQAIKYWQETNPWLIISDWNMPGLSGLEFLETVRKSDTKTAFLMCTSEGDTEKKEWCAQFDLDGWVEKPFTVQLLTKTVREVLKKRSEAA
jgi:two-component system chemotaxis response regulator CheY